MTARVLPVPATRVERLALEVLHARDHRDLHEVEDAGGDDEPARVELVAPVGVEDPAPFALVPFALHDAGVEQRVVLQAELLADRVEIEADLLAERVASGGDVAHLLEHRHVDVRLDVAHDARVPVPVPGAADPAGLVDQADVVDAGVAQLRAGDDLYYAGTVLRDLEL